MTEAAVSKKLNWDLGIDLDDYKRDIQTVGAGIRDVGKAVMDFARQTDQAVKEVQSEFRQMGQDIRTAVVTSLNEARSATQQTTAAMQQGLNGVEAAVKELASAWRQVQNETRGVGAEINAVLTQIKTQVSQIQTTLRQTGMTDWQKQADNYAQAIDKATQRVNDLKKALAAANLENAQRVAAEKALAQAEQKLQEFRKQAQAHVAVGIDQATEKTLSSVRQQIEAINTASRQHGMSEWQKLADNYAQSLTRARSDVEALKNSIIGANISEQEMAAILAKIAAGEREIDQLVQVQAQHVRQLKQAEEQRAQSTKAANQELMQAVQGLSVIAATASAALLAGFGGALKEFGAFEEKILAFGAITGATAQELQQVEQMTLDLGAATKFTAAEIGGAAVELAKMGFSAQETTQAMTAMTTASVASGDSLAEVSMTVGSTLRMFNMQASEAGKVSDIITRGANISALSFKSFADSIRYVGSAASAAGEDLVQVSGLLAILNDRGIKGTTAGNGLQNAYVRLQAPTKAAREAIDKLNLSIADTKGTASEVDDSLRPMLDIIKDIKAEFSKQGLNKIEQADILKDLFGEVSLNTMQVFMNTSNEVMDATMAKQKEFQGSTEATAEKMRQGFAYAVENMKGSINSLQISLGKELAPALTAAADLVRHLTDDFNKMPGPIKAATAQSGFAAGAIAGLLGILGGGSWAIINIIGLFNQLKGSMAAASVEAGSLRTVLTGLLGATGIGFAVGGAINLGLNYLADQANKKSDAIDQGIADDQKTRGGLSTAMHTGDKKVDVEQTRRAALEALGNVQRLNSELTEVNQQIENLKTWTERGEKHDPSEMAGLQAKRRAMEAELAQQKQLRAHYQDLLKDKKEEAVVAKEQAKNKEEAASAERKRLKAEEEATAARNKADKEQLKANKDQFRTWEEADKAFEAHMAQKTGTALEANQAIQQADTAMATTILQNAKIIVAAMQSTGACYEGVDRAFQKAFGKSPFHGLHAYMGAADLEKDNRFIEIQVQKREGLYRDLAKLPMGSVVVWGKGNSVSGHISIADGQGGEYSDHYASQMLSHYGGAAPRAFVLKGQEGRFGAIKSAAEQVKINEQIQHYNEMLKKAVAYRDDLEKKGLKDSDSWNQANGKVEAYKDKIAKLQGSLGDLSARTAQELAQKQEQNFKQLEQQAQQLAATIDKQITTLMRQMNQVSLSEIRPNGMTDLEKQADNYRNQIGDTETEVLALQIKLAQVNLTEQQREAITGRIKGLHEDINDLIKAQQQSIRQLFGEYQAKLLKAFEDDAIQAQVDDMAEGVTKSFAQIDLALDKSLKALELRRTEYIKNLKLIQAQTQGKLAGAETTSANAHTSIGPGVHAGVGDFEGSAAQKGFDAEEQRENRRAARKKAQLVLDEEHRQKDLEFARAQEKIDADRLIRIQRINKEKISGQFTEFEIQMRSLSEEERVLKNKLALQQQITTEENKRDTVIRNRVLQNDKSGNRPGVVLANSKDAQESSQRIHESQQKEFDFQMQLQDLEIERAKLQKEEFKRNLQEAGSALLSLSGIFSTVMRDVGGEVGETAGKVMDSLSGIGSGIARILSGDMIGGGLQLVSSFFGAIVSGATQSKEAVGKLFDEAARLKGLLGDQEEADLQRQIRDAENANLPTKDLRQRLFAHGKNKEVKEQIMAFERDWNFQPGDFNNPEIFAQKMASLNQRADQSPGDLGIQAKRNKLNNDLLALRQFIEKSNQEIDDNLLALQRADSDTGKQSTKRYQDYLEKTFGAQKKADVADFMAAIKVNLMDPDTGYKAELGGEINKIAEDWADAVAGARTEIEAVFSEKPIDWSKSLDELPEDVKNAWLDKMAVLWPKFNSQVTDAMNSLAIKANETMEKNLKTAEDQREKDLKAADEKLKLRSESLKKARTELSNADAKAIQAIIDAEQQRINKIEDQNKALQKQAQIKEDQRRADLKVFDAQDRTMFKNLRAGIDIQSELRAGLDDIHNPKGVETSTYSAQSIQEAMKERVDLLSLQNERQFEEEEITQQAYLEQKQRIAAIQAGFADEALKAQGLTNRQRIELEKTRADAYVQFQEAYREALNSRFDAEIEGINTSIEANNRQTEVYKDNIAVQQTHLTELKTALDKDLGDIDARISTILADHDEWVASAEQLKQGIEGPLNDIINLYQKAQSAAQMAYNKTPGAVNASNRYIPTVSSKQAGFTYQGADSQWYQSEADYKEAAKTAYNPYTFNGGTNDSFTDYTGSLKPVGTFSGGGMVPEGYPNDSFIAGLTSGEAVLPAYITRWLQGIHTQTPGGMSNTYNNQRRAEVMVVVQGEGRNLAAIEDTLVRAMKKADYDDVAVNGSYYGPQGLI